MPQREGFPNAVIASWGKVQLEQLDADGVSVLASGQSPRKGLLIDYLGDLRRSAQLGLPVYALSGGAGYLWSASIDRNGGGHLRFLTVDASALSPTTATQEASAEAKESEKIATENATENVELSRVGTESEKVELPKDQVEKLELPKRQIEEVAVPEPINADADAVENGTGARRATFGLIAFLFFAVLLLVWRTKARATRRKLLQQKSVAPQDTSPEAIVVQSELKEEISRSPAVNLRPCSHCNRAISMNDKFCLHCGAAVGPKLPEGSMRLCSSCRNQIGASDNFCRYCGASYIAIVAPSMNFSNEGNHEIIANRARVSRKRTVRKKAIRPQAESSQPHRKNPSEEIGMTGDPAPTDVPKETSTAVLKA